MTQGFIDPPSWTAWRRSTISASYQFRKEMRILSRLSSLFRARRAPHASAPAIVVLCGLPGAGKTTLARHLQENAGFYYADIGADARFKAKIPMWQIACELYAERGEGRSLVTEGVLITRDRRDRFSTRVWRTLAEGDPNRMAKPRIFLLAEDVKAMNGRRPSRSIAAYRELEETLEDGSDRFPFHRIEADLLTVEDRARFILNTLAEAQAKQ